MLKLLVIAIVFIGIIVALFAVNLFFNKEVKMKEGSCSTTDHDKDKGIGCCGGSCGR
jgi:hypothetical protein